MKQKRLRMFRKRVRVVRALLKDPRYKSMTERERAFTKATGESGYSFWTAARLIRHHKVATRITELKEQKHRTVKHPFITVKADVPREENTVLLQGVTLRIDKNRKVTIEFPEMELNESVDDPQQLSINLPREWLEQQGLSGSSTVKLLWDYETGDLIIKKAT